MSNMIKLSDIKPGYLLQMTDQKTSKEFYMTVGNSTSGLGCCCPHYNWFPLDSLDEYTLTYGSAGCRLDKVYGYATNIFLLDNEVHDRELLWTRPTVVMLTERQVCERLGYPVKVIKDGDPPQNVFKKSSFVPGMVVRFRDGTLRMVVNTEREGTVLVAANGRNGRLKNYGPNLTRGCKAWDIVEVWSCVASSAYASQALDVTTSGRQLLWKRDEAKRMTEAEISAALGYQVQVE